MSEKEGLSPWAHPKAQRWFDNLIESNMFALAVDDEIAKCEADNDLEKARMLLAFALLLGREGMWPDGRTNVLKAAVRTCNRMAQQAPKTGPTKAMTIAEHHGQNVQVDAVNHEVELMRRRLKMSNRVTEISPPASWGNLWE
jgi:hypothetical protein